MISRHALPNALGPTFQVIALNLAYLAGGVIVVEYVFNYPGIGGALRRRRPQPRPADGAGAGDADRRGLRGAEPAGRHRDHPGHARGCGPGCERHRDTPPTPEPEPAATRRPTGVVCCAARCGCGAPASASCSSACWSRVALFGPFFAPHGPTDFVGAPNSGLERGAVRHRPPRPGRAAAGSSGAAARSSRIAVARHRCSAWSSASPSG